MVKMQYIDEKEIMDIQKRRELLERELAKESLLLKEKVKTAELEADIKKKQKELHPSIFVGLSRVGKQLAEDVKKLKGPEGHATVHVKKGSAYRKIRVKGKHGKYHTKYVRVHPKGSAAVQEIVRREDGTYHIPEMRDRKSVV